MKEKAKVEKLMVRPDGHILVVDSLQTFTYFNRYAVDVKKQPYGEYMGPIYFHNRRTRGVYSTKGKSFALKYNERLVLLSQRYDGSKELF